ncbi:MAG: FkbM family methyltransferase [Holosporaceae bacterium]|nr:FkbM family methyltransferase [Holosporaceae bacterium]
MANYSGDNEEEKGFFNKNKLVSLMIIVSCVLFVFVFFVEKTKIFVEMVPTLRGEVSLENGFSITTINNRYPILIKKDDPIVGNRLRFSGDIKSLFSEVSIFLAPRSGVIVEVGSHFGYNVINIAKKLGESSKYYAFEPNAGVFSCLKKSVFLNDIEKVVILRSTALSDSETSIPIEDCLSMSSESSTSRAKPRMIVVGSSTVDKELENEPTPVSLLLIDVPGSEFSVIKGAQKIIENSQDIKIVMSFDRENSIKNSDIGFELQRLKNLGFNFYLISSFEKFRMISAEEIMSEDDGVLVMTRNKNFNLSSF